MSEALDEQMQEVNLALSNGFKLGDVFTIDFKGRPLTYEIISSVGEPKGDDVQCLMGKLIDE